MLAVLLSLFLCACPSPIGEDYATSRLHALAEAVGAGRDGDISYEGKRIRFTTNDFGEIDGVGYELFSEEIIDAARPYGFLLHFLERYALELDLRLDGRSPEDRMDIDKVICMEGNITLLRHLDPAIPPNVRINESPHKGYVVSISVGEDALVLEIPADCQLILGADAKELEDIFENHVRKTVSRPVDLSEWTIRHKEGDVVTCDGGKYLSDEIRGDVFLSRGELICDVSMPEQSVRNILVTGQYHRDIPLKLVLDRYGYVRTESDITVQQLISLCRAEGCSMYVGLKGLTDNMVKATVFALNTKLSYNHVLSFYFPIAIIEGQTAVVSATAYTYIPLHNVAEGILSGINDQ